MSRPRFDTVARMWLLVGVTRPALWPSMNRALAEEAWFEQAIPGSAARLEARALLDAPGRGDSHASTGVEPAEVKAAATALTVGIRPKTTQRRRRLRTRDGHRHHGPCGVCAARGGEVARGRRG